MVDDAHASRRPRRGRARLGEPLRARRAGRDPGRHAVEGGRRARRLRRGLAGAARRSSIQRARPFLFSTRHPPAVAAACREAIRIMQEEPELHERLWANTRRFKAELARLGFDTGTSETPITPVILGDPEPTIRFSNRLFDEGVFGTSVVFPTVALDRARIRTIVTAAHTDEHAGPGARGVRHGRPRAGRHRRVTARTSGIRIPPTPASGRTSSTTSGRRASRPGSATRATCRSTRTSTRSARRTRTRCSRPTAPSPSSADPGARDHRPRRLRPHDARLRLRVVRRPGARRARGGRALGGSWPRDPVRRRGDLRARVRGRDPRLAPPPSPRLRHRQRPHQRDLALQGVARRRRSWRAGRCAEIVAPYFDEVDRGGRVRAVRHDRPPRLREALPRPARAARAARGRAGALRAGPRAPSSSPAPRWRSTRPGSASCPARRIRRRRSSRATGSSAAAHVTIGSDAHRTEWFSYGLGEAYRLVAAAGFGTLAFRRGVERVQVPVQVRNPT